MTTFGFGYGRETVARDEETAAAGNHIPGTNREYAREPASCEAVPGG